MKDNIKIIVACHKQYSNIPSDNIYLPIHVGKALHPEVNLGFKGDNNGDNISDKNDAYSEVTAIYWAWKNLKNVDYIGLCHYRRYFGLNITNDNIGTLMNGYDAIFLDYKILPYSGATELNLLLTMEEFLIMEDSIIELYPEYRNSVYEYYHRKNVFSQNNMFIMRWHDFDNYCQFLFPLVKYIESRTGRYPYARLRRNIAYIAEGLQGLYAYHNNLKIRFVDKREVGFDEGTKMSKIGKKIRNLRNNIVFNLFRKPEKIPVYDAVRVGLKKDGIELKNL